MRAAPRNGSNAATVVATRTIAAPTTKGRAPKSGRIEFPLLNRRIRPAATAKPAARPMEAVRDVSTSIPQTIRQALSRLAENEYPKEAELRLGTRAGEPRVTLDRIEEVRRDQ